MGFIKNKEELLNRVEKVLESISKRDMQVDLSFTIRTSNNSYCNESVIEIENIRVKTEEL